MEEKKNYSRKKSTKGTADYRSEKILIRLTPAEKETIRQNAFKANLRAAEYVRGSAVGTVLKEAITPEQMTMIRKLSGMANNLNQVTKALQTAGIIKTAIEIEKMVNQINQILNQK